MFQILKEQREKEAKKTTKRWEKKKNSMGTAETYTWQRLKHKITLTSNKVRSLPPVMFHTIPVALSIPISSKGD
jgi:hypothetical protein